jgi:PAS domain S-box-containing protein
LATETLPLTPGLRMVVMTDARGLTTWVSPAFTQATGWTLDDLRGRTPGSVLQGGFSSPAVRARLRAAIEAGVACRDVEIENQRKDGSRYIVQMDVEPQRDDRGTLVGFIALQSDVTALRSRAERSERLHRWHEATRHDRSIGMFERNLDTGDAYWDDRLCEISGMPPGTPSPDYQHFLETVLPEDRDSAYGAWKTSLETLKPSTAVYRMRRPDGAVRWLRADWIVHRAADGGRVAAGTVRDITADIAERRAAAIGHQQLLLAADLGQVGLMRESVTDAAITANPAARRIFGLESDAPITIERLLQRVHPDDRERARRFCGEPAEVGAGTEELNCRVVLGDGTLRHVIARRSLSAGAAGEASEVLYAVMDVSADRAAEARARHLDRSRAVAVDIARLGVWESHLRRHDGRAEWESVFDDRMLELYGWTGRPHRFPTEQFFAAVHPDDAGRVAGLAVDIEGGDDRVGLIEFRIVRPDGRVRWVRSNWTYEFGPDGSVASLLGAAQDVTDQRLLETQLRQDRDLLRATQRMAHVASWWRNLVTGEVHWSPELYEMFGRDPGRAPPSLSELERYYEPQSWTLLMQRFDELRAGGEPAELQLRIVREDGSQGTVRSWILLQRDAQGRAIEAVGCLQDISESVQMREEIAQARDRLQALVDASLYAVVVTDDQARYVEANPAACELLGYPREELLTRSVADLYAPDNDEGFGSAWHRYLDERRQVGRVKLLRKDGGVIVAEYLAVSNVQPGRHLSMFSDVSARVEAETALFHAQERLRDLTLRQQEDFDALRAELARDVHDELGQTLGALKLELDTMDAGLPRDSSARVGTRRMRDLVATAVGQVRDVARELRSPVLDIGLAPALRALGNDMSLRGDVDVVVEVPDELPAALPRSVDQAIYRIVQEALTNAARHADASTVRVALAPAGGGVRLEVSDNGCGFDAAATPAIAGLGLLGMRERANQIGADLRVHSVPGEGTRVLLHLNPRST